MKKFKRFLLMSLILSCFISMGAISVKAHDGTVDLSFNGVGYDFRTAFQHNDQDPFKGLLTVNVTNTGTQAWGDFHFQIYEVNSGGVNNVIWDVSAPNQPTSSQSGLSWNVNNAAPGGATLDLFFYGDSIQPQETAWFKVYTDNTQSQNSLFGVLVYPTPVPVPGAAWLMGSGLLGLLGLRRRS
jgi:hypothetical protein